VSELPFTLVDVVRLLQYDMREINARIESGDYRDSKSVIAAKRFKDMLDGHTSAMLKAGALDVTLEPYAAAGGWVGLRKSYRHDGFQINDSAVYRIIR